MATKSLAGRVALVTGATRGIGKGIAIELGAAGALVYVTGRTLKSSDGKGGSLEETAEAIRNRGGQCVPVRVDHEQSEEVEALFQRIAKEQDGRLDILVNNAYKGVEPLLSASGKKFWETEPEIYDDINNVGLRNHYYCTVYAARLMVPRKQGLIVVISSAGGLRYLFNVAYGMGKVACDRMAADTGIELKKYNVASISLWPGAVLTDTIQASENNAGFKKMLETYGKSESPEYAGRIIAHLARNPSLMQYSGKIVTTVDYGTTYGVTDTDGTYPTNIRSVGYLVAKIPSLSWLSGWIPGFLKIPYWLLHQMATKPLAGQVALVTGATRGIGKGIAIELGGAGAIVYFTGRTMKSSDGISGSLEETAEIRNRGGQCIPVRVDHENTKELEALFQRIAKEQDGRLDILINNAFKAVTYGLESIGIPFWETEPEIFDITNNVGLRNHYYCAVYAARLMVPRKQGLIITISSLGGLTYFGFVAYGIGKAACDRLAADAAFELKKYNIASISLWPGLVSTELMCSVDPDSEAGKLAKIFGRSESPEFVGRVVTHLAQNSSLMKYTGKIITTADYAEANGIVDTDGQYPRNMRSLNVFMQNIPGLKWLAPWIPSFLKVPHWLLH